MRLLLLTILLGTGLAVNAESFRGRIDIVGDAKNGMILTRAILFPAGLSPMHPGENRKTANFI